MKNKKQIEAYKKILKALMVGTLACTTVGCAGSENEPTPKKEETTEKQQETKPVIPTEIMSEEETKELTEGTIIELKDLKKIPNEEVLEEMGLMYAYHVILTFYDKNNKQDGEPFEHIQGLLPDTMDQNGEAIEKDSDGTIRKTKLVAIEIVPIVYYNENSDGTYTKSYVNASGNPVNGGEIKSEKVIAEHFGGPQKTK